MPNPVDVEILYHLRQTFESASGLSSVTVFQGWVPNEEFEVPSLSIISGDVDRTDSQGVERTNSLGPNSLEVFFRDAEIQIPVTLELYATSKTERMNLAEPVRKVFRPDPPDKTSGQSDPQLHLTLDGHHDADAYAYLRNSTPSDSEGVGEGYFRRSFDLVCETVELTRHEYDKADFQTQIEVS